MRVFNRRIVHRRHQYANVKPVSTHYRLSKPIGVKEFNRLIDRVA